MLSIYGEPVEPLPEHPAHELAVGNAAAHELVTDALRHGLLYLPQPVLLQAGVIVAVEVVNAYYRPSTGSG